MSPPIAGEAEVSRTPSLVPVAAPAGAAPTLIGAVGELGVAVAHREAALAGVPGSRERAREHVRRAQAKAAAMVAASEAELTASTEHYDRVRQAAVEAGWSSAALADMGYPASTRKRSRRRAAADAGASPPAPAAPGEAGKSPAARADGDGRAA